MALDEPQADMLDAFWVALLAQTGARPPIALDPGLAMVALCLAHDLPAPEPDPRFSERLRSLLLGQARADPGDDEAEAGARRDRPRPPAGPTAES